MILNTGMKHLSDGKIPFKSSSIGNHIASRDQDGWLPFPSSTSAPWGCVDLLIFSSNPWFAATSQVGGHLVLPIYPAALVPFTVYSSECRGGDILFTPLRVRYRENSAKWSEHLQRLTLVFLPTAENRDVSDFSLEIQVLHNFGFSTFCFYGKRH